MTATLTTPVKLPEMNLTLTVTTMLRRDTYHFRRGDLALKALQVWDNDPFTVDVQLTNRVPDPDKPPVKQEGPFGAYYTQASKDILVWRSTDVLPRWATAPLKKRLRAEAALAKLANAEPPHGVQ